MSKIGVLALQGDFEAHWRAFQEAGADAMEVRTAGELEQVEGLVIPGGESTTMLKVLDAESLFEPLRLFGARKPIFGTCAGAILLARDVSNPTQKSLSLMDIGIERNAYGRQLQSKIATVELADAPGESIEAVFIRAPIIRRVGAGARVLGTNDGDPVLVEDGIHLAATFHPELTGNRFVQKLFLEKVRACPS